MWENIKIFIEQYYLGDLASIISLFIVLIGFALTLRNVVKSVKASEKAEEAVRNIQKEIRKMDTVEEFSSSITAMEEIKRHQRESLWHILPERYSSLRKTLNAIKVANPYLTESHKELIQRAVQQLQIMESQVESANIKSKKPENPARYNEIMSKLIDELYEALIEIKTK
jgi:hypothetical protein